MKTFSIAVVSPEEMLYEGDAEEAVVPGKEGTMSILSRHAPLLAALRKGTVRILTGSKEEKFEITSGFVEVSKKDASFVNVFVRKA